MSERLRTKHTKGEGNPGQFAMVGKWERKCVCEHTLGEHTAARPYECLEAGCFCQRFVAAKVVKP